MGKTTAQMMAEMSAKQNRLEAELQREQTARTMDQFQARIANDTDRWLDLEAMKWHTAVGDAGRALFLADKYYTDVLSAQAKPSFFGELLKGLITGLAGINPEFAIFAVILKMGSKDSPENEEKQKFLKEIVKSTVEAGKKALEDGKKIEEDNTKLKASIRFLKAQIEGLSNTANWVTEVYSRLKGMVADVTPVQAPLVSVQVRRHWIKLVGTATPYRPGAVDQLALLFVYDMLRAYCRQNVELYLDSPAGKITVSKEKAVDKDLDVEFEGLEPPKRERMYEYFKQIERLGDRPRISNWHELLERWEFAE